METRVWDMLSETIGNRSQHNIPVEQRLNPEGNNSIELLIKTVGLKSSERNAAA